MSADATWAPLSGRLWEGGEPQEKPLLPHPLLPLGGQGGKEETAPFLVHSGWADVLRSSGGHKGTSGLLLAPILARPHKEATGDDGSSSPPGLKCLAVIGQIPPGLLAQPASLVDKGTGQS